MKLDIELSGKHEYNASIENISVRLLINDGYNPFQINTFPDNKLIHTHLYTELFVCLSGEMKIQANFEIIHLLPGDAAIIPPNIEHSKIFDGTPCTWHALGFSIIKKTDSNCSNLYKKLSPISKRHEPTLFKNVPDVGKRVAALHRTTYADGDCLPAIELVCILSTLTNIKATDSSEKNIAQSRMPDIYRMAWFEDLIANRYYEPLATSSLANMLHISTRHLSRIIKEQYGMTFHEILTKKRLNTAAILLTSTSDSVNTILKKVGYSNSSCFYKDFAKKFGVTPLEYRTKS